jgi:8-oxo-dGTP diphosphatase
VVENSSGDGSDTQRQVVVGVALIRERRVLAARRAGTSGGWEFPGGKVEPGETDRQAAARELREELGVEAEIGTPLGEHQMGERYLLRVYTGRITAGEPVCHEHAELRWLAEGALYDVAWLNADRPFVEPLRRFILTPSDPSRFGDE